MRILITNQRLSALTGTEVYVLDLAMEWIRRQHLVACYTREIGPLGRWLAGKGIPVVTDVADLPWSPDVIHGQHNLPAMTAIGALPGVPAIYVCHGASLQEELPPAHPRILRYVGVAERMRHWLRARLAIDDARIETIANGVDLDRFRTVRPVAGPPRRALLYANAAREDAPWVAAVRAACAATGLTLDVAGMGFGRPTPTPERLLPDYDLVFASGRSALEAIASGAAVVVVDRERCGPIAGADNLAAYREINFTPPHDAPETAAAAIEASIRSWSAAEVVAATEAVRTGMTLTATCDRLETLYTSVQVEWESVPRPTAEEEARAFGRYLQALSRRPG